MHTEVRWGLNTGCGIGFLSFWGSSVTGAGWLIDCGIAPLAFIAAAIVGYLCARREPAEQAVKEAAVGGAIVGGAGFVGKLIGAATILIGGAGQETWPYLLLSGGVSMLLIAVSAGVGALVAYEGVSEADTVFPIIPLGIQITVIALYAGFIVWPLYANGLPNTLIRMAGPGADRPGQWLLDWAYVSSAMVSPFLMVLIGIVAATFLVQGWSNMRGSARVILLSNVMVSLGAIGFMLPLLTWAMD
ncbi:MAG: hypothetical protein JXB07_19455 [Anaerolineae bacterium]|nr:hypothetical protein [Anaerolineae bacterium]